MINLHISFFLRFRLLLSLHFLNKFQYIHFLFFHCFQYSNLIFLIIIISLSSRIYKNIFLVLLLNYLNHHSHFLGKILALLFSSNYIYLFVQLYYQIIEFLCNNYYLHYLIVANHLLYFLINLLLKFHFLYFPLHYSISLLFSQK